jgi:major vault protein
MTDVRQKIPVPRRFFLWSLNETSGEILTHVGPTEFTPSANDRIVRFAEQGQGGYQPAPMEARPFVIARDGEYALLSNPCGDEKGEPNGSWVPGGNKERDLRLGTKKVIPGPCAFPLWPGQSAEVRPAHKLTPNHYLLVEIVGAVDERAPYYPDLLQAAGLSEAVIDAEGETTAASSAPLTERLSIGQRIVIQGRLCSFFIPPTGVEVVPALEETADDDSDDGDAIESLPQQVQEEAAQLVAQVAGGISAKQFSVLKNELRHRQDWQLGQRAVVLSALDSAHEDRKKRVKRSRDTRAERRQGPVDPYARRAVVLGPKEFCVLFDADGKPRIVRGPARVSPGPNDTFMQRGSRRRVYDAYELGEHQALWIRIITPISRERLAAAIGSHHELPEESYEPGHELIIRGRPSVFFPFIEAEIVSPQSREPHFGNDHSGIVIDAVGIDQKSGIYVRDLRTGMVKMVRGETSYLVDPRTEEHVYRRVPREQWNLWIGHAEPHKITTEPFVETPWAISITVPNNEACLITSRHGRRTEVGPKVVLLEHEEALTGLTLSKGKSKDGADTLSTCFLRVRGARVADSFVVESSDFVRFDVRLGFAGGFEGDDRDKWFQVEDPVKLLADTARARLREACRKHPATELIRTLPSVARGALLGDSGRLTFEENGLVIDSVDVLSCAIVDSSLAQLFGDVQREAVQLQLKDEQASRRIVSERHQDTVDREENELLRSSAKRRAETGVADAQATHDVELVKQKLASDRKDDARERSNQHEKAALLASLERARLSAEEHGALRMKAAEVESESQKKLHAVEEAHLRAVAEVEAARLSASASAEATKLAAIQPQLVGALHGAADSEVMKAAANNMNLVALLGGRSPAEILSTLLRGTPLERTPRGMTERAGDGQPSE